MNQSSISFTNGHTKNKNNDKSINIWSIIWGFVWGLIIFIMFTRLFWLQQVSVVGASMEPNYHTSQLLLVDQIFDNFKRGQVVAVYDNPSIAKDANYLTRYQSGVRFLLKRIIGLPGEEIEIRGSKVIIYNKDFPDGTVLTEDYIDPKIKLSMESREYYFERKMIPQDSYFLMGDNRTNSLDSRNKGSFPAYAILGFERYRFFPFSEFHIFKLPEYTFTNI
jgi:signal peptidase I